MVALVDFAETGAVHFPAVYSHEDMTALGDALDAVLRGRPGRRLQAGPWTSVLPALTRIATGLIGEGAFPVRAVAFDKTAETDWMVGWHQDRTITVASRIETKGFGPWSTKDGIQHVEPPTDLLGGMVTLRLHIDDCGEDNAPLKVALGSHRLGLVAADKAAKVAATLPLLTCLASTGDVWAYSTLILHASERSLSQGRRRVLQVDYTAADLPGELQWKGLD